MRLDKHKLKATKRWKAKHGVPATPRGPGGPSGKPAGRSATADEGSGQVTNDADGDDNDDDDDDDDDQQEEHGLSEAASSVRGLPVNPALLRRNRKNEGQERYRRQLGSNAFRYEEQVLTEEEMLQAQEQLKQEQEDLAEIAKLAQKDFDPKAFYSNRKKRDIEGELADLDSGSWLHMDHEVRGQQPVESLDARLKSALSNLNQGDEVDSHEDPIELEPWESHVTASKDTLQQLKQKYLRTQPSSGHADSDLLEELLSSGSRVDKHDASIGELDDLLSASTLQPGTKANAVLQPSHRKAGPRATARAAPASESQSATGDPLLDDLLAM